MLVLSCLFGQVSTAQRCMARDLGRGEYSAFLCAMGDDPAEAPPPPRLMLGSTQEEFEDEPPSDRD